MKSKILDISFLGNLANFNLLSGFLFILRSYENIQIQKMPMKTMITSID